ncbi:hypothetical protein LF1_57970 [Rubripirellula obstinata]|uniref:Uncharacterized protein n=1 Tax=Rubripirellula obstinata TaxID=406547 RepID=A0A5B1CB18_9BACT|nr:hypothetical protein [Rubripirellula obstinata]KAA1256839.1 hypothetical protein LF1_58600 [Rubripirellula obstinata]KAA1256918.1 hypothetical protein LF1_57970 [Rubripirellula obstinata]
MADPDITVFTIGTQLDETIHILLRSGTFTGDVDLPDLRFNTGLGHPALDGDICVDENGGMMIAVRLPDLDGKPGTFVLGDRTFNLVAGRCFLLTKDYQAIQLPHDVLEDAYRHVGDND